MAIVTTVFRRLCPTASAQRSPAWAAGCGALLLAGCATPPPPTPDQLRSTCVALAGTTVPASSIGLPSQPAVVDRATLTAATATLPEHCQLQGHIPPLTAGAQRIHFQLNLPLKWNGKSLQYGGGGFNGVLINGLAPLRDAEPTDALPLARGYATYGTDSGHQVTAFPGSDPGAFASNDEMLENFAFASYKKVRDVAVALMQRTYGQGPKRLYYFGGSEGGREGLAMAQRFPTDYDGIVSVVPVVNWTGLFHAFVRAQTLQFDGWLPPIKTALVARHVAQSCDTAGDAPDGLADGVINNALACSARVDLQRLRCEGGADAGPQCLSDGQIAVLRALHTPYGFPFPLANGINDYPPWLWGHEDSLDGPSAVSLARWVTGSTAPTVPPDPAKAATQWLYGSNWIRHAIARDSGFDVRRYRPQDFQARVQQTSALMDATNPDLSAFFARGGKIIVRENAGDRAQSPLMGVRYVDAVRARLGDAAVQRSLRLYWSPASTHGGNARVVGGTTPVPTMVDLLDPLDRWVDQGQAPDDALVQTQRTAQPPFTVQATRPLCAYPRYPHYVSGDAAQASSYRCTAAAVGR